MSTEIKDGGPAFGQVVEMRCVHVDMTGSTEWEPEAMVNGGLTVRDYFAATVIPDGDDISVRYAETLLGRSMPDYAADPLANAIFWADARARLRYIEADAMLRARESA